MTATLVASVPSSVPCSNTGADDPLVWYGGATMVWLHPDHQGSITGYANAQGLISAINAYDE